MIEYVELEGVGRICGKQPSWDAIQIHCEYIYGRIETIGDYAGTVITDELNIDWGEMVKLTETTKVDEVMRKAVKECLNDYCYSKNMMFLCKLEDNKITECYFKTK